jgi:hypothetical protein
MSKGRLDSPLAREARLVQNPALGAALLWRFTCGYSDRHRTSSNPALQELFLVLPIILHQDTFELLESTNLPTGLHGFTNKFTRSDVGKSDVLLGVNSRAVAWRTLTWESIRLGVRVNLISVAPSSGQVLPMTRTPPTDVPTSIKPLLANAEKLGSWCAELSIFEIGTLLKVSF